MTIEETKKFFFPLEIRKLDADELFDNTFVPYNEQNITQSKKAAYAADFAITNIEFDNFIYHYN